MTTPSVLQKLLRYPHSAVFDKSPLSEPVLRIRSEDGLTWEVGDEVLTVVSGGVESLYSLDEHTVGTLAAALESAGLEVSPINPDFAGLSATVLVEGAGSQFASNGDRLGGFKNPLWAQYAAYAKELRAAGFQVVQALRQMIIYQAEGEWLDLWGYLYNTPRLDDEADPDYAERIPREAFRIRVNAYAIEKAVFDATGKHIRIEEPWRLMFRLDESQLSGTHRFYDGKTVGPHLIRPVSQASIDWTDVLPVIHRNRAAGIVVLDPEVRLGSWIDASIDGTVWVGISSLHGSFAQFWPENRLNYLVLSAEEITRNWPVMISSLVSTENLEGLLDPVSVAFRRTIAKASICLSVGPALGDENAIFPRSELTQLGGKMVLSDDLVLSDPDQKPVRQPVDVVRTEISAIGAVDTGGGPEYPGLPALNQEISAHSAFARLLGKVSHLATPSESIAIGAVGTGDGPERPGLPSDHQESTAHSAYANTPVRAGVAVGEAPGYTWAEAEVWGEFTWGITEMDIEGLESAAADLDDYANNRLPEDMQ